jgi:putative heme-binding domain-containing protein
VPAPKATALRSKLLEPGVITQYMKTDPIPVRPGGEATFTAVFPPEAAPGGPFGSFSVDGKEMPWKPLTVADPGGKQPLEMPENSVVYLTATYQSASPGTGWLTTGSDDGLQVWVNGAKVISKNDDRELRPDVDRAAIGLKAGVNTLLFKVNNKGGGGGIQSRMRSKVAEFDPREIVRVAHTIKGTASRGREVFTTAGCVKCHTLDRGDEPKGPFLGDVGVKFDAKYIVESILRPNAKIAQGFSSEMIVVKGQSSYSGFVSRETADEVQLRDLTGKVTIIVKDGIQKRTQLPGSMMPQGLVDDLSLDDFASLLTFLESLKK